MNQPTTPPLISRRTFGWFPGPFWRALRAWDRHAGHNEYEIRVTNRIAVQSSCRA